MGQRRWTAREVIALLLIATMTSSACSSGCRTTAPASQATDEAAAASAAVPALDAAATNEALSFIEQVAKQPANAPPDVAAQAASLGRDAAKVFAFVRGEIRYQAYDGVLRGAAGALGGRAANAWDTALLVADLLRKSGFEVRFAHGTLSEAAAAALVGHMFDQAMQPARQTLTAAGLQPPVAASGVADAMRRRIDANWATNTAEVMAALKKAGIALGTAPPVSEAALVAEARDHVWVEYKDGLQWLPVDPVATSRLGEAAADARETFTEIPAARQHTVTIALNVEQRGGGAVDTKPALTLQAPAADLHGQPIMLTHQVDIMGSGAWKATPMLLVGDKASGGTSYGPAGVQSAAEAGAGGIGGRLNQMFGGGPASAAELSAVWLDVTMTLPDGRSETVRREVIDRIGPVAREAHSEATAPLRPVPLAEGRPTALSAVMACAVTAGPLNAAVLTGRVAAAVPVLRDEALRARLAAGDTKGISDDRLKQIGLTASAALAVLPQSAHLVSQQYAAEAAPALGQQVMFYESSPRLAIATFGGADGPDSSVRGGVSLDLRWNALRVVGRGVTPASIISANIARGVLDGAIEDALVAGDAGAASAVSLFAGARAKGIGMAASVPSSASATGWPGEARARLQVDPSPAVAVVTSNGNFTPGGAFRVAWWRIDTSNGDTVGVLDSGLHGAQAIPDTGLILTVVGLRNMVMGAVLADLGFDGHIYRAALLFALETAGHGANAAQRGWNTAKNSF